MDEEKTRLVPALIIKSNYNSRDIKKGPKGKREVKYCLKPVNTVIMVSEIL